MTAFVYENDEFDAYARDYEQALQKGLSVSGESAAYFARGRVAHLASCLETLGERPSRVLDFGCGIGSTAPLLASLPGASYVLGLDTSAASIALAARTHGSGGREFKLLSGHEPAGDFDLVYTNGVFHHIAPGERPAALDFVLRSLRPGGFFALWENNPWNPGTRYVMSRIPFDKDAVPLTPREARRRAAAAGFTILRTDFRFIFPRFLRALRVFERPLARLPFGAQYQVLCRRGR